MRSIYSAGRLLALTWMLILSFSTVFARDTTIQGMQWNMYLKPDKGESQIVLDVKNTTGHEVHVAVYNESSVSVYILGPGHKVELQSPVQIRMTHRNKVNIGSSYCLIDDDRRRSLHIAYLKPNNDSTMRVRWYGSSRKSGDYDIVWRVQINKCSQEEIPGCSAAITKFLW